MQFARSATILLSHSEHTSIEPRNFNRKISRFIFYFAYLISGSESSFALLPVVTLLLQILSSPDLCRMFSMRALRASSILSRENWELAMASSSLPFWGSTEKKDQISVFENLHFFPFFLPFCLETLRQFTYLLDEIHPDTDIVSSWQGWALPLGGRAVLFQASLELEQKLWLVVIPGKADDLLAQGLTIGFFPMSHECIRR